MNFKKILTIVFGLACVMALAYYTFNILNDDKKSSSELIDFAIKDTAMVTKIRITRTPKSFEIKNKGKKVAQEVIQNTRIRLQYP